jgi:hypothetical protein
MNKSELTLDIEGLRMVAGYAHWIPQLRGLYLDYFEKTFPGWTWNQIIPVLIKAKILVRDTKDPAYGELSQGLYIASDIESVSLWINDGKTEVAVNRKTDQKVSRSEYGRMGHDVSSSAVQESFTSGGKSTLW